MILLYLKTLYKYFLFAAEKLDSINSIFTLLFFIINILLLFYGIKQIKLSRKSLEIAIKSIDNATITRQLAFLPKHQWVINVDVRLIMWKKDLRKKIDEIRRAVIENDGELLKEISKTGSSQPSDLGLSKFDKEHMPEWLSDILISGAQYYYNCIGSVNGLWSEKYGAQFILADRVIESCDESCSALKELQTLIKDMVPQVILNTPASVNEEYFYK